MYSQTMPLVNFSRESGWNTIEAWLVGASPVISGSTGIDNALYTVTAFQQAHQSPKFCADKDGKVVDCNSPDRVPGGKSGGDNNPVFGGGEIPGMPRNPQQGDGKEIPGLPKGLPPSGESLPDFDDWFKRGFLAIAAIVIIALAIVSLR